VGASTSVGLPEPLAPNAAENAGWLLARIPRQRRRNMPDTEKAMLMLGGLYERLCKIPLAGVPMVRAWNRIMARLIFHAPGSGANRKDSIVGVKDYLLWSGEEMNFPFEIIEETVGPDSFEFFVGYCPYGYKHPHQDKPCDAAMEMDRTLFKLLGAELIIKETVVAGAPKCRMLMQWRG
jgi:hypothetical protein